MVLAFKYLRLPHRLRRALGLVGLVEERVPGELRSEPRGRLAEDLAELRDQHGENVLDDEDEPPCPSPAPRRRGRPPKRSFH